VVSASQASANSVLSLAREYGLQPSRIWRWSGRLQEESTGGLRFHPVRRVEPEPLDVALQYNRFWRTFGASHVGFPLIC